MRRTVPILAMLLCWANQANARGLLIPEEKTLPPLAMLDHKVSVAIDDQVATTRVEQTFRNHTDRPLEATYVFPVPQGASVNKFTMWVGNKEVKGELVEAKQAREIYNSIVRRTQDPGLLEYAGGNLFRMRVFPVPAKGAQKVSLSFTSVAQREGGLVEYIYPLKSDSKSAATLEDFSVNVSITSQHGVENVYSPTHTLVLKRKTDKQVEISYNRKQSALDRDFQLFYQLGSKAVGLTALTYRPIAEEDGHFLMLISPQLKLAGDQKLPRDLVLVLDTSGSMSGVKMKQARQALKFCLDRLETNDRFGLVTFATSVNTYRDKLLAADTDNIERAKKWVDALDADGGTNINDALATALDMRPADEGRSFTIVFFTDGCPTVGEVDPEAILKNTLARNTASTRIFTFGVGDDVNATLLDRLADRTRAWASYVRPAEDIEIMVSSLHAKIAHPAMTNLKLTSGGDVKLKEVYPPQLPDLFHGRQLVVAGRYEGKGKAAIKLTGKLGKSEKEFVYEITFPERTGDDRQLVEHLWARRKVGYLLNEIRAHGQNKELVAEVTKLARRHGIATPYTSYLLVPDGPPKTSPGGVPDVRFGGMNMGLGGGMNMGGFGFGGGMNMGGMNMGGMNMGGMNMGGMNMGGMNMGGFGFRGGMNMGRMNMGGMNMGGMNMGGFGFGGGMNMGGMNMGMMMGALGGMNMGLGGMNMGMMSGGFRGGMNLGQIGGMNLGMSIDKIAGQFGQFGVGGGMNTGVIAGGFRANMNLGQFGIGAGGMNLGGLAGQFGGPRRVTPDVKIISPASPADDFAPVLEFAQTLRKAGFDGKNFIPLPDEGDKTAREEALRKLNVYFRAAEALAKGQKEAVQTGELGVDLSIEVEKFRQQRLLAQTGQQRAAGHEFQRVAGAWIDRDFKETMTALVVKAQSDAYFRILERRTESKDVFRMGNRLVWVSPSGTALVIDPADGETALTDKEIDALFVAPKK